MPSTSTAASRTCPATSASGRTCPAERRSTSSRACAAVPPIGPRTPQRKKRLLEVFQLDPTKKGRAYSKGNRQKVALVAAFATPADLYILDEPTSGLDPLMEAVFDSEIRRVAAEGATVLLSSHILSEVEQLCDRVTIIRAGRTVETGTLDELRHLTRTEVTFRAEGVGEEALAQLPGAHEHPGAGRAACGSPRTVTRCRLLRSALARLDVRGLTVAPPSLEELFLRHYGDDTAGEPARPGGGTMSRRPPRSSRRAPAKHRRDPAGSAPCARCSGSGCAATAGNC